MNRRVAPFVENMTESGVACLVTMVQGNLLALSLGHWLVASKTGIIAGGIASIVLVVSRTNRQWVVASLLGMLTAIVDYLVHPGHFGPVAMEAIVTGLGAALLSYLVALVARRIRKKIPATAS